MTFRSSFEELFQAHSPSLLRFLVRLSGDPDTAADLTQEAFVRLFRRGSLPDSPTAWLFTVGLNLFRNARATRSRRGALLSGSRAQAALSDPPPSPSEAAEARDMQARVRTVLEGLGERDRTLLLLRAEGMNYRDLAATLELNEASVGTLLARAKRSFRDAYKESSRAP